MDVKGEGIMRKRQSSIVDFIKGLVVEKLTKNLVDESFLIGEVTEQNGKYKVPVYFDSDIANVETTLNFLIEDK